MRGIVIVAATLAALAACGGSTEAPKAEPPAKAEAPPAAAAQPKAGEIQEATQEDIDAFARQLQEACVQACEQQKIGEGVAAEEAKTVCTEQCDPENSPLKALVPSE